MATACRRAEDILSRTAMLHLEGETGTGKSALVAALVGAKAAEVPIFNVDCATLGDSDADTEHLRRVMEQARVITRLPRADRNRAALIFDNVDELPSFAQAELRRFLNEQEEFRDWQDSLVFDGNPFIISTSRKPLIQAVHRGTFRDDLYYLLAAARIYLPPLREREHPEILAQALASQLAGRTIELSAEATDALRHCPFHGNVRELRSTLEYVLMTLEGDRITLLDLGQTLNLSDRSPGVAEAARVSAPQMMPYDERTMILDALTRSRWNVSEAARVLGMGRATINRKLKLFGLKRPT